MDEQSPDENPGGSGGETGLKDARLAARAAAEAWPIDPRVRRLVMNNLSRMALDPKSKPRLALAAAKALLGASRHNLAVLDAEARAVEHEELKAQVEDLERRAAGPRRQWG